MFVRLGKLLLDGRADNVVDRLCFRWSPAIFLTITGALFVYWLVGAPVTCWAPAQFTASHSKYTESMCWISESNFDITKVNKLRSDSATAILLDDVAARLRREVNEAKANGKSVIKIPDLKMIKLRDSQQIEARFLGLKVNLNESTIIDRKRGATISDENLQGKVAVNNWTMTIRNVKLDFNTETMDLDALSRNTDIPTKEEHQMQLDAKIDRVRKLNAKRYHLWVPFVLLLMASIFVLPHWVWHIYIAGSDVKLDNLSAIFRDPKSCEDKRRDRKSNQETSSSRMCCLPRKLRCIYSAVVSVILPRHDVTLLVGYTVYKVLQLIMIIVQIGILDKFLADMGDGRLTIGAVLDHLFYLRDDLPKTDLFPTDVMFDFEIRNIQNVHRYTIQCLLAVNHYNPVIMAIVCCWVDLLYVVILADLIVWCVRLAVGIAGTVLLTVCNCGKNRSYDPHDSEMKQLTRDNDV